MRYFQKIFDLFLISDIIFHRVLHDRNHLFITVFHAFPRKNRRRIFGSRRQ